MQAIGDGLGSVVDEVFACRNHAEGGKS